MAASVYIRVEEDVVEQSMLAAGSLEDGTWHLSNHLLDSLSFHSPRDTGEGARGWFHRREGEHSYRFGNEERYMEAQWKGTGVYVGDGPIRPRRAKALRFPWRGRMTVWKGDLKTPKQKAIFAAWARERGMVPYFVWPRGVRPDPYVERAMRTTEDLGAVDRSYVRAMREDGVRVRG